MTGVGCLRADMGRGGLRVLIVDAFSRMIVGWRVAAHMRTTMVLDAIDLLRAVPVTVPKETRGAE